MSVESVTVANFAERIEHYQEVALMDFWAPWCVPCQLVSPLLSKLAQQYEGNVRIARLNVDEQPAIAARYQVVWRQFYQREERVRGKTRHTKSRQRMLDVVGS